MTKLIAHFSPSDIAGLLAEYRRRLTTLAELVIFLLLLGVAALICWTTIWAGRPLLAFALLFLAVYLAQRVTHALLSAALTGLFPRWLGSRLALNRNWITSLAAASVALPPAVAMFSRLPAEGAAAPRSVFAWLLAGVARLVESWLSPHLPSWAARQEILTDPIVLAAMVAIASVVTFLLSRHRALSLWRAIHHAGSAHGEAPPIHRRAPFSPGGKRIVICCDGTSNDRNQSGPEGRAKTNIARLFEAVAEFDPSGLPQHAWYDAGVGTGTSRHDREISIASRIFAFIPKILPWIPDTLRKAGTALGAATAYGITENIEDGYRQIVRSYEPGDQIYIFGFSRGAYTARCIAGVIKRCGLLRAENLYFVQHVMDLYRRGRLDPELRQPYLARTLIHDPATTRVHVLGVFDTVAALGLPLWGWWFRIGALWRNTDLDNNALEISDHVYHAVAMDERRSQYFPTLIAPAKDCAAGTRVTQVWFRGAHADVGGGYADDRRAADLTLEWMLRQAHSHGLHFKPVPPIIKIDRARRNLPICPSKDPRAPLHDEMAARSLWDLFGSWPRWHPVQLDSDGNPLSDPEFGCLHHAVITRANAVKRHWSKGASAQATPPRLDARMALEGFYSLQRPGDAVVIDVPAHRVWHRTGVVIERDASYRISWVEGAWQDQYIVPPVGPIGGGLAVRRNLARFFRRKREENWMCLIGHVAHPRAWPVLELGFLKLLKFLLLTDPKPLVASLIPLGRHLETKDDVVVIRNDALAGMLHVFANDLWSTAVNNSGQLRLKIERVEVAAPIYVIRKNGQVTADASPENGESWDADDV